jgi:hypothetical protein
MLYFSWQHCLQPQKSYPDAEGDLSDRAVMRAHRRGVASGSRQVQLGSLTDGLERTVRNGRPRYEPLPAKILHCEIYLRLPLLLMHFRSLIRLCKGQPRE